jgi:hypothetical protein
MSRFGRRARHADDWASPHERARARAAQRLDWPLDADEHAWLDEHLASCASCRALATDYVDIRDRLRGMRDVAPPPPRDLWARTAAAIEQESRRGRAARRAPTRRVPVGALSGVLVVMVVLGATLLSNAPRAVQAPLASVAVVPDATQPVAVASPAVTPLAVAAGDVGVVELAANGSYDYSRFGVDEVCPANAGAECPTARGADATALAIAAEPQAIIGSPDQDRAVVVGTANGSKANDVIVMMLPTASPSLDPTAVPSVLPSEPPLSPGPSTAPSATPTATDLTASPTADVASPPPVESPDPSDPPATQPSVLPSDQPATPSTSPVPDPTPTPESIAIASDLIVVGQTAAFSPDGQWFAFTARPAAETTGPDIYVWQVGDAVARPVTTDHRSVFASWAGALVVGSRPATTSDDAGPVVPESFVLDPGTGTETAVAGSAWRPVVAPTGDRALVVNGTVTVSDDGRDIHSADGRLELRAWDPITHTLAPGGILVADTAATRFDARWDETGTAFAVWIEDAADPSFGRLSLYFIDPVTGELEQPESAPRDEPAQPGFSIGRDRLAWVTPEGQGGEGSRVLIAAWTEDGVGTIETAPGERAVVVR